jgi:hypothetical protein
VDGDDIILVGFSRGAFTARSVSDMIASLGILSIYGLDHFYDILKDYEHLGDKKRDLDEFMCKTLAPYNDKKGKDFILWEDERKRVFREWLRDVSASDDERTELRLIWKCRRVILGSVPKTALDRSRSRQLACGTPWATSAYRPYLRLGSLAQLSNMFTHPQCTLKRLN